MYCTKCGSQVQPGAAFCISCGDKIDAPVPLADVTAKKETQRAQSFVQPAGEVLDASVPGPLETCPWCGWSVQSTSGDVASCPQCGATLQVRSAASHSGWLKLPPRKDMAKLQFGNSSCQIEGLYVPVAEMNLAADGSVYFSHHVLLWVDPGVKITTMSMRGGWKRMLAGMPLIMTQAQGPGHIAFSKDKPGELIALPLQPGQAVDVREHMFLMATSNVEYDWFRSQIWYQVQVGNDTETHHPIGMFMDRFCSPASPGLLLLHAGGSVLVRELASGEPILVKPSALIFKDPSVEMQLHFEHPGTGMLRWGSWTSRSIWLRLVGPGRVAIQSVFERMEHEGASIVSHSYATSQHW